MRYCPLTFSNSQEEMNLNCEKEACMWWDDKRSQCCIKSLVNVLENLSDMVESLAVEVSHVNQNN